MRPGLSLALGAGLQVSGQGAAATLVPAGTTLDLRSTVTAQSPANHLDNGNRQLSVTWDLHCDHQKMTNHSHRIRPKLPKTQGPRCQLSRLQVERQMEKQPAAWAAPCHTLYLPAQHHPGTPASPRPSPADTVLQHREPIDSVHHPQASSPTSRGHRHHLPPAQAGSAI